MNALLFTESPADFRFVEAFICSHKTLRDLLTIEENKKRKQVYFKAPDDGDGKNQKFKDISGIDALLLKFPNEIRNQVPELRTAVTLVAMIDMDYKDNSKWGKLLDEVVKAINETFGLAIKWQDYLDATDGYFYFEHSGIIIAIWAMPNNKGYGTIEDFAITLRQENEVKYDLALDYLNNVKDTLPPKNGKPAGHLFGDRKLNRAQLAAWLSAQKTPGISIAAAFEKVGKKALFDANTPAGAAFARFLKRLHR